MLGGEKNLASDVKALRLFDKSGALDPHSPLLDAIRIFLASRQGKKERTLGKNLLDESGAPPYGWDRNAVRVGVAACVRAGTIKVLIGKMPHPNPADATLQKALRDSREFEKVELVLEDSDVPPEVLEETRALLMKLAGKRKIDETPIGEYETARSGARFTETEVWKQVQGAKASAGLELQTLLSAWRDEARHIVQDATDRLPEDLKQQLLDEEMAREMAAPLDAFVAVLDAETDAARVAALPAPARRLVDGLGAAIRREVAKRTPKPPTGESQRPPPPRETRHVRFSDVATIRRIRTEDEWHALVKKLDERVRALLEEFEVELE